ncbi:replication initiator protein A, partial [Pseudoflavonifractor sp. 60]|nr:replication initiator protein A [Pseudoflavonifractor sp. 60]
KLKENQLKGASEKPPAPFGRYKNIFLSESEYAELKEEYPDRLERFIEELSQHIAANGKSYINYAAAIRIWAGRDRKGTGKKGIPDYSYKEGESL